MGKASILIVEDVDIIAEYIRSILTKHGYSVIGCIATGAEAVDVALGSRPDLVLMDIKLKGETDGIMAYEQIKKSADIPIVFVSAYADERAIDESMEKKPSGYVIKPFTPEELIGKVELALASASPPV